MSGGFEVQPMERHENIARKRDLGIGQRKEPDKCLGWLKIPIQESDDVRRKGSHVRYHVAKGTLTVLIISN